MGRRRASVSGAIPYVYIFDAGAVIAENNGNPRLRALLAEATRDNALVIVPTIVITETFRGGPTSARLNRLLKAVHVPEVDEELAKAAGELLGAPGLLDQDPADAQVMAEAIWYAQYGRCTIMTSDPEDMEMLRGQHMEVRIVNIDQLSAQVREPRRRKATRRRSR